MKIVDYAVKTKTCFNDLNYGDVFLYEDNYYIVVDNRNMNDANAVNLLTGHPRDFSIATMVKPLDCELIIK